MTPLWTPRHPEHTVLAAFARAHGFTEADPFDALYAWSLQHPDHFWQAVWDHVDVRAHAPPRAVIENADQLPGARWFPGATMNFSEHLLRHDLPGPAVIALDERGHEEVIGWPELRRRVARLQTWLAAQGVGPGDRVAAWLPNRAEAVVAMLATASLGAIWSSASPDFGVRGVLDRFSQIQPKVLIVADGTRYAGRSHDMMDRALEIMAALNPASTLVVPVLGGALPPGTTAWADALSDGRDTPIYTPMPFDAPLYILYSSGTTGAPKCIVHGIGGTLLQHGKELSLHTDVHPGDVLFYYTTTGWMMWNWLVSGLLVGASVVLWDGSPIHPTPDALWRMADHLGVTHFGTSPRFLGLCEQVGQEPGRDHDLSRLRVLMSTGSPLSDALFRWTYDHVKQDIQLASISGGTDIISCFMLGSPTSPVYPGEIQKRGLGMAVQAWSPDGHPRVGEKGELVCVQPFPSMPIGFWGDTDGSRYRRAYFEHFPGVWRHGDFVTVTERGGVIVHGRSDAILNPGGVRIGSAEIYGPVEALAGIEDCVVVAWPREDDVELVLFVVMSDPLTPERVDAIKAHIRSHASPRHVPARVLAAPAIPRTVSGKKVEIAVLQVLQGQPAPNVHALANPDALDWFATEGRALLI